MKRKARLALLGALLQSGACAAEQTAQSAPAAVGSEARAAAAQPGQPTVKSKRKTPRNKKPVGKQAEPPKLDAQSGVSASQAEQGDQSVQLKGVRG